MRTFHVVVIGVFAVIGVGGILFFALFQGWAGDQNPYGSQVVIWGTLDDAPLVRTIADIAYNDSNFGVVSYEEKDSRTFREDLTNALAEGRGPDIVILPSDLLLSNRGRITPTPYEVYPARTYMDTYIDGAEIFMLRDGIYAIPVAVDPLLMYWNRSIFATKGLANPPRTWEELVGVTVPTITEKDFSYNITRAAVALGEYSNVRNAQKILALLFMQAGSRMIVDDGERLNVVLNQSVVSGVSPADAGLKFYTEFSSPTKNIYTWNKGLPQDRDEFLAEDLALYFGLASEVHEIRDGNPNLNFDVAEVPQSANARLKVGYGTIYGMALMKNSRNQQGAALALSRLVSQQQTDAYAQELGFGPVFRASYQGVDRDAFMAVVERASLVARGWLDPDPRASDNIFKQMVEDYTSGRLSISSAISDAEGRLRQLVEGR